MRIKYSPSVICDDREISYTFNGESITVLFNEKSDVFDFSAMPDGTLPIDKFTGQTDIETVLDINPIVSANKTDGIVNVELLKYIGLNATDSEKFPEWEDI